MDETWNMILVPPVFRGSCDQDIFRISFTYTMGKKCVINYQLKTFDRLLDVVLTFDPPSQCFIVFLPNSLKHDLTRCDFMINYIQERARGWKNVRHQTA